MANIPIDPGKKSAGVLETLAPNLARNEVVFEVGPGDEASVKGAARISDPPFK